MTGRSALVCTYGVPRVDKDSGSRRIMSHVEFLLDAAWHVTYFAINGAEPQRYAQALRRRGVGVYDPSTVSLEELASSGAYDLALFAFWQPAEQYVPTIRALLPSCRIVVDSVDLQLLRDARRTFGQRGQFLRMDYGSEMIGELNVYAAVDGVLTVSKKEAELVNDFVGAESRAFAIPDCEELGRSPFAFARRKGVVFVGSFNHPPNAAAVEFLCTEVLPLISPKLLAAHPVSIVGAGLDPVTARYAEGLPVRMIGWVPSVIPYLERARVSVVPLLYGAGTKRKLLQALMLGTPTVSTSLGTEGMSLEHGEDVLLADDAAAFARAIERLLTDRELWGRMARAGRRSVLSTHGRSAVQTTFHRGIRAFLARPARDTTLPEPTDELYLQRLRYQLHQKLAPRVAEAIATHVPDGSKVAVLGEGCAELLRLNGCTAIPYPDNGSDGYAASPATHDELIDSLEQMRAAGVDFLLLPVTARWRFTGRYPEFASYLSEHYPLITSEDDAYELYSLTARSRRRPSILEWTGEDGVASPLDKVTFVTPSPRLIAFYLPQFHPIPENNEWWGEGFTEWTNVARAEPLFADHYQPHVPADLGFYDLRLPEIRVAQAELAQRYGISAFCYYHYWFGGKQLLERPFAEVLSSGEPNFPFCLCWANEPWSRRWDGREHDLLQPQMYSEEDDLAHIRWLLPALADPRAVRIEERPVFIVYQAHDLPDPARTVDTWRREATRSGLPDPYLMTVETGWDEGWDATRVGFDAKVMFRPQFTILRRAPRLVVSNESLEVRDFQTAWPILAELEDVPYRRYETVCPRWDNSPRTGSRGVVLHNSTPEAYGEWLTLAISRASLQEDQHRIVFINAWNEWGEGCHLEPDQRFGHAYLEATRAALGRGGRLTLTAHGAFDAARAALKRS